MSTQEPFEFNGMEPPWLKQFCIDNDISLTKKHTYHVYEGFFNNKRSILRIGYGHNYPIHVMNELGIIVKGKKHKIEFLPQLYFIKSESYIHALIKEFIPGRHIYNRKNGGIINDHSLDLNKCEQDVSEQIFQLYSNKMSNGDVSIHNILFDEEKNKFTLFDYSEGKTYHQPNDKLTAQTAVDLHILRMICRKDYPGLEVLEKDISDKMKIPLKDAKQAIHNGQSWNLYTGYYQL